MSKPIVFVSHSSADQKMVRRLKELLHQKVGGTVDIFVSSDGQSMPFGRNWVYEMEKALRESKLMFVLVSPQAVNSKWIYFESGFAYSTGIEVIPVGVMGVDLSQVPPPLGLLQGFNINSADGLNNLIQLLNRKFDYSLQSSFTKDDYSQIFMPDVVASALFGEHLARLRDCTSAFNADGQSDPGGAIQEFLLSASAQYYVSSETILSHGLSISVHGLEIDISLDPALSDSTIPLLQGIVKKLKGDQVASYPLTLNFLPEVEYVEEMHRVTSRLHQVGLEISGMSKGIGSIGDWTLTHGGITFNFGHQTWDELRPAPPPTYDSLGNRSWSPPTFETHRGSAYMHLEYSGQTLAEMPLCPLLSALFDSGVLFTTRS